MSYQDIKVVDGGWEMDAGQQPNYATDLYSVAQDIKHAIMEKGLARELQGERNAALRADVLVQIEQQAEQDERIIPGTATAIEINSKTVFLTAKTYDFGTTENIEITNE